MHYQKGKKREFRFFMFDLLFKLLFNSNRTLSNILGNGKVRGHVVNNFSGNSGSFLID